MNKSQWCAAIGLLLLAAFQPIAIAQPSETESQPTQADPPAPAADNVAPTGTAADLRISPRLGIGYESSTAGIDGSVRFEGFLPLFQSPGEALTFLETQLLLDNDGNVGGNVLLGHRFYDAEGDRIWGGYIGLDARRTDDSDFHQIGLGLESLGEIWDFRLNGYLPIGDTRQLVDERAIGDGRVRTSTRFQGHLLLLQREQERLTLRNWEAALGGMDAEVGARLARWNGGDLRGYGGLYFYGGPGTDGTVGWRLRLEGRPSDNVRLGVSLQDDSLFGTNAAFSVSLTFPRVRPRGPITDAETVIARMGEPIFRTDSIVVDEQQDTDIQIERTTQPLMNPEEEEPYWFQHVTLGRGNGGDGTVERPFSAVQDALNATRSDGNDIVYVDQGSDPEIPAFTIPDRVQVLSQGPVQRLAGMPFPGFSQQQVRLPFSPTPNFDNGILVRLPFSGDGNFPTIREATATNLVTLGNRTTLAGFRVTDAPGNAIIGSNVDDVELRDNTITNAGERGIFLENVADSAVMFDNTITGSRGGAGSGQGILIRDRLNSSLEATISNHVVAENRVGIEFSVSGNAAQREGSSQQIVVTNTTVQNNRDYGLHINAEQFGNHEVVFSDGTISDNGASGIWLQATNGGSQEFTLSNSSIRQNAGDGIWVEGGVLNGSTTAAQEVFIRNNTIESNGGTGINIAGHEVVAQEFAIENNTIRNNGGAGIRGIANNVSFQEYVTDATNGSSGISNNIISGNGDQGIDLNANNSATLVADIQGNRLENNRTAGRPDVDVTASSNSVNVCVVAINNTSASGIRFDNNSALPVPSLFEIGDLSNVSVRNVGNVEFLPNLSTFTNKPGATSCFQ